MNDNPTFLTIENPVNNLKFNEMIVNSKRNKRISFSPAHIIKSLKRFNHSNPQPLAANLFPEKIG
jgi:hypothetical protein